MFGKRLIGVALLCASTAVFAADEELKKIEFQGETMYGVRSVENYPITGTYRYEGGEPRVDLNPDGTGCFARHGMECRPMHWWIAADETGAPKTEKGEIGQKNLVIAQYDDDGSLDGFDLTIRYDNHKMYILGEREKDY